jgi:hypothetical protein
MISQFTFYSSEKLILITYNKVATSYSCEFFRDTESNNYEIPIQVDSDYNVVHKSIITEIDKYYKMKQVDISEKFNQEWKSILDKTTKKDILILYRNPFNYTLSGIVQEFGISIQSILNKENIDDFFSKSFFEKYIYENELFELLKHNNFFEVTDNSEIFQIYKELLIKYIELESSFLIGKHHTKPYLIYLYLFLLKSNIDTNKLKILDIDDNRIKLKSVFESYGLKNPRLNLSNEEKIKRSNFNFKNSIENLFSKKYSDMLIDNPSFNLDKSINYLKFIISIESEFYDKLKKLPYNLK